MAFQKPKEVHQRPRIKRPPQEGKHEKGMAHAAEKQVQKALAAATKSTEAASLEEPAEEEAREFIMSLLKVPANTTVAATTVKKVTLQSILKKVKKNRG